MVHRIGLAVLIVAALARGSAACICMAMADESKICQADFAIKVTVLRMNRATVEVPSEKVSTSQLKMANTAIVDIIRYGVYVEDVFRLSHTMADHVKPRSRNVTFVTPVEPQCDRIDDLEVGGQYFVAGKVYEGMPGVSRCSSVVAKYREGEIVPYRDHDVKVDVKPECPDDEENVYMKLDAVDDYDSGDVEGGATTIGYKLTMLTVLMATTAILMGS